MRILVASWPGYGHLLPMVPLIRAAQRRGAEVLVTTGADLAPVVERLGVPAHRSGLTLAESYARLPVVVGELPAAEQPAFAARHFFGAGAVDRARDIADLVAGWRPDLVVHDTLELGSATVAVGAGIPHVTHGYGPSVPGTDAFARVLGAAVAEAGLPDPVPAVLAAPYLEPCPPGLHGPDPEPWQDIRPIRPNAGEPGGYVLPPRDRPIVYLTLGTVVNQNPEAFRAVLEGCLRHPVDIVATTGPDVDPAVLGELPPQVLAAPYLPQADVLPHCTAVVSHCGAGTMFGALCHGLPHLAVPLGADQPANAAALAASGAGLVVTPDGVAAGLGRLLAEPSFRAAAERLAAGAAAMPTADEVLDGLVGSELQDRAAGLR
ncbi:glycosyltransferase [Pseudonocardia ailaonensis]|uniref:Glycosyltransferase n=1 Tax=Pseudonocardia ailaonensis TaxID=367279 RepID=A0ABN2MSX4_9PSEU